MNEKAKRLAEDIEQYMFCRGEYDVRQHARIRWVLCGNRCNVEKRIMNEIVNGDVDSLVKYFTIDVRMMDEDDELISQANYILTRLNEITIEFARRNVRKCVRNMMKGEKTYE